MFCQHVCVCTMCMPGALRGPKRVLKPVDLELMVFVSHHVLGPLNHWAISPAP